MSSKPADNDTERTRMGSDTGVTVSMTSMATTAGGVDPAAPSQGGHNAFAPGTKIGEFEILGLIGEGGFGIVYLAHDRSLDRKVALKEYMPSQLAHREDDGTTVVMRSDRYAETFEAGMRSFINEAKLLAQFNHHSLVKVYRFWEANGTAYMVMPFYEGVTLKQTLKELGRAPEEPWLKALLSHLLDALEIIHRMQCYHRDIAPDNILIQPDGTPLLLDFGAARRVIGDMTQALTVILKPGYAPIEQYAEVPNMKQGAWTDLYALSAVIHLAIVGKAPLPSVARVVKDAMAPLATAFAGKYSDRFLRAIDWGLSVKPEERPQDIASFREALGLSERDAPTRMMPGTSAAAPAPQPADEVTIAPIAAAPEAPAKPAITPPAAAPVQKSVAQASAFPASTSAPAPAKTGSSRKFALMGAGVFAALAIGGYVAYTLTRPSSAPSTTVATPAPAAAPQSAAALECAKLKLPVSYCDVLAMLRPLTQHASIPEVRLKGGKTAAIEGEKLVTEAAAAGIAGFLYVDLYDPEGNVVHLVPNAKEKKNNVKAGERVTIGDDGILGMEWDVVPPLGKHLLVVMTSKAKLFDAKREDVEPAQQYASALREALSKQQPADVAANYRYIDFVARK